MLSALSNQGIGLPARNRKVFTSDVIIRAKANANKVTLSHDGTNGKIQPSSGYLLLASPNGGGLRVVDGSSYVDVQSSAASVTLLSNTSSVMIGSPFGTVWYGQAQIRTGSTSLIGFSSLANATGPMDTGIARNAAGVIEINNGTAGTLRDLKGRTATFQRDDNTTGYIAQFYPANGTQGIGITYNAVNNIDGSTLFLNTARGTVSIWEGSPSTSQLHVGCGSATRVVTTIRGAASQSANLTEWQNSSSVVLASIGSDGLIKTFDSTGLKYLAISQNGTDGIITNSNGNLQIRASGNGNNQIQFCDPNGNPRWWMNNTTGALESQLYDVRFTSTGGAIKWNSDVGISRNAAGVLEVNSGTSGAYRDLYLQSLVASQNITVGSGYWLKLANASTALTASADGAMLLSTFGASTTPRIQYGGTSSLYPMTKRNGTGIDIRLADDSAYAGITASQVNPGTAVDLSIGGSAGSDIFHGWISSNAGIFAIRSNGMFGASNSSTNAGGSVDIALARHAAGAWQVNNGSLNALRDIYARTFYGIAQAATDVPLLVRMAASQSANAFEVRNSASALRAYIDNTGAFVTTGTLHSTGSASLNGMSISGYSIRSSTSTALYLIGSSSGVEIGNYGTALATVKPNSANGTTSLQYFLTSSTAISEASAGVAEVNNGTAGTLRDLSARNVYSNGNPVGTGKDIYNMIW